MILLLGHYIPPIKNSEDTYIHSAERSGALKSLKHLTWIYIENVWSFPDLQINLNNQGC